MRIDKPAIGALALVMGIGLGAGTPSASAQGYGNPSSLGGFGASSGAMPGLGGSPMILPFGGTFEGFMPGRMRGGSALSFQVRSNAPMGTGRRPFSLSPLSGGMSGMSGGAIGGKAMAPIESGGTMGLGDRTSLGGMRRMPGVGRSSVMSPSFGYPFRQPPSLVSPASAGMGMSM